MSTIKISSDLLKRIFTSNRNRFIHKSTAATAKEDKDLDVDIEGNENSTEIPASFVNDEDLESREQQIQQSRNKSRLLPQHLRMLNHKMPYDEPQSWIHQTAKYNRMAFGKYGLASGVDPRICFYTKEELDYQAEYERVAHPLTLQQMIKINETKKLEKQMKIRDREDEIAKKLEKLDTWTNDLNAKIAKKEADALAAKQRKDRIIEEVRRQFGFKMDSRDERFKELLEKKEKEDKKQQKEARRKIKEEKMLAKLQEKTATADEKSQEVA